MEKRKAHLEWTRDVEREAAAEVKAEEKAYKKEMRRKQLAAVSKDDNGKPLW